MLCDFLRECNSKDAASTVKKATTVKKVPDLCSKALTRKAGPVGN